MRARRYSTIEPRDEDPRLRHKLPPSSTIGLAGRTGSGREP